MKEPNISVEVYAKASTILKVNLKISPSFSLKISNASKDLENALHEWIDLYLQKRALPPLQLSFINLTPFQKQTLLEIAKIPFGKTKSYKDLALLLEKEQGSRAVGNACGKNPFPLLIPCHRVINANGNLGGFSLDLEIKKRLLSFEKNETPF